MAILEQVFCEQRELIQHTIDLIRQCYRSQKPKESNLVGITARMEQVKVKKERLLDMRTDGEITKEEFLAQRQKLDAELQKLTAEYEKLIQDAKDTDFDQPQWSRIQETLEQILDVHFKDIKLYPDKLNDCGIMAYPLEYMSPKLPGYGDVNWGRYVSALTDIGFDGFACIEVEDKAFESCREKILDSIRISKRYMDSLVI